jgi:hypothetical protein
METQRAENRILQPIVRALFYGFVGDVTPFQKAITTTISCSNPKKEKNSLMLDSTFCIFSPSIQI